MSHRSLIKAVATATSKMNSRPSYRQPPRATYSTVTDPRKWKTGSNFAIAGSYTYDGTILLSDDDVRTRDHYTQPLPTRDSDGVLHFPGEPEFVPNMTPKEIIMAGSFGATYFRPIHSSVTGIKYDHMWDELPQNWLGNRHHRELVSSSKYKANVNTYKRPVGGSLDMWESKGWILAQDPYGWFQWYCRYYLGRRSADDERQIGRWVRFGGERGRWKISIVREVEKRKGAWDDVEVVPGIRQILQHWAYKLSEKDYVEGLKKFPRKNEHV